MGSIEQNANVNIKLDDYERTPIYQAVKKNQLDITKLLIEKKANLKGKARDGNTLLTASFYHNPGINREIIDLLIDNGVDVNDKKNNGDTLLSLFISGYYHVGNIQNKLNTIEYLISKGADVNAKDKQGRSILLKAAYQGDREVVELLQKHGAKY